MRAVGGLTRKAGDLVIGSVDLEAVATSLADSEGVGVPRARQAVAKALERMRWGLEGPFSQDAMEARRQAEIDDVFGGKPDWM